MCICDLRLAVGKFGVNGVYLSLIGGGLIWRLSVGILFVKIPPFRSLHFLFSVCEMVVVC